MKKNKTIHSGYCKPVFIKEKKLTFPREVIKKIIGHSCLQCTGCHGCR